MQKYLTIFTTTIKEYFAYRLNFVLWRLRMFINLIIIFFFWMAVMQKNANFAGYSQAMLLAYILYSSLISDFVLGTRTSDVAAEINNGNIINNLLKPISFFRFYLMKDFADKFVNIIFSLIEVLLVIYLARTYLILPQNLLLFLVFFVNGIFIAFYINLLLSFIGFWTTESWAPRFVFLTVVYFLSGSYFPLDMLPKTLYRLILLTPIPYLFFVPTKIIIGRGDSFVVFELIGSLFWVVACRTFAYYVWEKGNKSFSFWGR